MFKASLILSDVTFLCHKGPHSKSGLLIGSMYIMHLFNLTQDGMGDYARTQNHQHQLSPGQPGDEDKITETAGQ